MKAGYEISPERAIWYSVFIFTLQGGWSGQFTSDSKYCPLLQGSHATAEQKLQVCNVLVNAVDTHRKDLLTVLP